MTTNCAQGRRTMVLMAGDEGLWKKYCCEHVSLWVIIVTVALKKTKKNF